MNNLVLNRSQIEKLYEISQHFKEIAKGTLNDMDT